MGNQYWKIGIALAAICLLSSCQGQQGRETWKAATEASTEETSTQTDWADYAGIWSLDGQRTEERLEENGYTLQSLFGTGLGSYGASMEIGEDGSFQYYIGIGNGGTGSLKPEEEGFQAEVIPYEPHSDEEEILHLRAEHDPEGDYLVMEDYFDSFEGSDLYWRRGVQETENEE